MNRFYGIQDSCSSRVKYYSSDESSMREGANYEGDADDDSFASAQFSSGHSIAHSDIPDFASVSSKHSLSSRHSSYSKSKSKRRSRGRSEASKPKLRHIESQVSLAYSVDTTLGVCPSPLQMEGEREREPVAAAAAATSPTKKSPRESHDQCENDQKVPDDDDSKATEQTPPGNSNDFLHFRSPPKLNSLEFPNITPFGNGGFSPIELEETSGNVLSPKIDHPYVMYTSPLRSSETSPTCSSFGSTGLTTPSARDVPSHIRSQRVEKIKSKLRSIEGTFHRRNSEVSSVFRGGGGSSRSVLSSPSKSSPVRDLEQQPAASLATAAAKTTTTTGESPDPSPHRPSSLPGLRLVREAMSFCLLIYIVSIAYLNHRESKARSVELQVSQMRLMEHQLLVNMESEAHSMQMQIEKYKLMTRTLASIQEPISKQLVPVSSVVPSPSVEYRYYRDPFQIAQCELDVYEYLCDDKGTYEKSIVPLESAPSPVASIECKCQESAQARQTSNEAEYSSMSSSIDMTAPTIAPSVPSYKQDNLAPSLILRQKSSNAISKEMAEKRFSIPMHDFYLVQTMLD